MNSLVEFLQLIVLNNYIPIIYILPIIVVLCGILLYFLRWRDYLIPIRERQNYDSTHCADAGKEWPKLSVIVPAYDQARQLSHNLPSILDQDYPNFEVIVVNEASTDDTEEVIKQLQLRYRHLRCTFIPSTADICRRKLAITLGVRASRSDWAVITTASASPVSPLWLRRIAECIDDECDIVLGYSSYLDEGSPYSIKAIYERLWIQLRAYRSAISQSAIGGSESNFCIRKSAFLAKKGYADNLYNDFGESHQLIQTLAEKGNTRLSIHPDAMMIEDLPLQFIWNNMRIYYRETMSHCSKTAKWYLRREGLSTGLVYMLAFCFTFYVAIRLYVMFCLHNFTISNIYIDIVMFVLLVSIVLIPLVMFNKCSLILQTPHYRWKFFRYALQRPFENAYLKYMRWKLRNDFSRS